MIKPSGISAVVIANIQYKRISSLYTHDDKYEENLFVI